MHEFPVCFFNPAFRGCQNPINGCDGDDSDVADAVRPAARTADRATDVRRI